MTMSISDVRNSYLAAHQPVSPVPPVKEEDTPILRFAEKDADKDCDTDFDADKDFDCDKDYDKDCDYDADCDYDYDCDCDCDYDLDYDA